MVDFWIRVKQLVIGKKGLASIGIANVAGSVIGAVFWFYIATVINPEQYGQIHYFIAIAGMAQLLSLIAAPSVLTVYGAKNIKIHSTLFLISLIAGLIASIVVFFLLSKVEVSLLIFGFIVFELANGLLLGRKLFSKYAKFFLAQKFLTLILGVILYYSLGAEGILFALVLSYVPCIWIIIKEFKENRIDFSLLKPRKGFLINNYGINISTAVGGQIDKLIIAPLLGFELLGNYSLAIQFLLILMILPNVVFKYLLAQDSSGENTKKLKEYTFLLSIGISIFGIIFLPKIIPTFFPKFIEVIVAVQIISFVIVPRTVSLLYESKFLALEKSKFVTVSKTTAAGISVIGFLILGPIYGIVGLAISLVVAYICSTSFLVIIDKIIGKNVKENH